MTRDDELLRDFVEARFYPDVVVIFVAEVLRSGHEPSLAWAPVVALPSSTSSAQLMKQQAAVLKRKRFFAVCQDCGERNPQGWMHDALTCQSCAEKAGAVY